jgi:hypothetical protein
VGSRYLTGLADWCRAAGLVVVEVNGWQTRARSSGGYDDGRPWCVMWHHTASNTSPGNDVAYIIDSPDAPLANLYLARDGAVWICAAGATNTNGKGGPHAVSRGTVPLDKMNTYAVGIEAANDGVGEWWPAVQVDAFFALSLTLTERLGLMPTDVCHHSVWAPTRKVDPARADAVEGDWWPRATNASGSWSLPDTIDELAARAGQPPPHPLPPLPPTPTPVEDDMTITAALGADGTIWVGDGMTRYGLPNMDVFSNYVVLGLSGCYRFVNTSGQPIRELGDVAEVGAATLEALGRPV